MNESLKDLLSRTADAVGPAEPDLLDIERRVRRRKGRNRLGSGVAAALIALAATAFLVRAFDQPGAQVPVGTPSAVPEHLQAQVIDQIDVGPFPQAIAVGEGGVWVDVPANAPEASPEIVHIDPSSDRVVARIPVPEGESDIAAGEGSVWVTRDSRTQGGQLALQTLRIDPATDKVIATLPDVGAQVAVDYGYLWALAAGSGDSPTTTVLMKIDPDTGSIISSQPVDATVTNIATGGGSVWLTTVPDPRVGNLQANTLIQVDASTLQVLRTLRVTGLSSSDSPVFADEVLWVPTCCIDNNVSLVRVDPATGETVGDPVRVGEGLPFADAFGHLLLMSERGALSDLNPATGNVEALAKSEWPAAHGTTVFDPTTGSVWVSNYQHTVTRIDVQPEPDATPPTTTAPSDSTLLVSSSGPSGNQALLSGTLTTQNGCVGVSGGAGLFVYVVWPAGYSLINEGSDTWLADDSGTRIAKIGDEVRMSGGVTNLGDAKSQVPSGIPPSCAVDGPDAYWFSGTPEADTPIAGRNVFAHGTDPVAGAWQLFTEQTAPGPVLGVAVPTGQDYTVPLEPLGDKTFGSAWSITGFSTSDRALLLAQVVAPNVARAEIRLDDGSVFQGELVDLPGDLIGPAKVFVAGFESTMSAEGQTLNPNGVVVAFGANGQELSRRRLAG